jgi:hypothetical protein
LVRGAFAKNPSMLLQNIVDGADVQGGIDQHASQRRAKAKIVATSASVIAK